MAPSSWSILPLPRSESLPILLVKCQFGSSDYTIYLTDLTYVWSETLDRRQIIRRALNDDTSIDPSEDAGQLKILLRKIEDALRGEQQTSLQLRYAGKGKALLLSAVAPLPAPLHPLIWTMHLEPSSQEAVTSELVVPSLIVQLTQGSQISSLLGQIKEKDHVIGRLLDKLESSGVELSSVFPGTAGLKSGKKGSGREAAAKYVKGLGVFDFKEAAYSKPNLSSQQDLVQEAFATRESHLLPKAKVTGHIQLPGQWWTSLGDQPGIVNDDHTLPTGNGDTKVEIKKNSQMSEKYDDEFQRQVTPPRLQGANGQTAPVTLNQTNLESISNVPSTFTQQDDETTEEEVEHRDEPKNSITKKSAAVSASSGRTPATYSSLEASPDEKASTPPNARKRVGVIGGRNGKTVSLEPNNIRGNDTSSPAAESEDSNVSRRGLGPVPSADNEYLPNQLWSSRSSAKTSPQPPSSKPHGRLGTIGGKGKAEPIHGNASEQPPVTRTPSAAVSEGHTGSCNVTTCTTKDSSPETETAQEKADRKREELKRQLREKAKAPVKRQRRF
ncbi:MAG: hypothetical protein M1812_004398 [Candelaria pacifica]|nr:MAG: hypothetical protein M1812_004398 [Candelaria pacifica]